MQSQKLIWYGPKPNQTEKNKMNVICCLFYLQIYNFLEIYQINILHFFTNLYIFSLFGILASASYRSIFFMVAIVVNVQQHIIVFSICIFIKLYFFIYALWFTQLFIIHLFLLLGFQHKAYHRCTLVPATILPTVISGFPSIPKPAFFWQAQQYTLNCCLQLSGNEFLKYSKRKFVKVILLCNEVIVIAKRFTKAI